MDGPRKMLPMRYLPLHCGDIWCTNGWAPLKMLPIMMRYIPVHCGDDGRRRLCSASLSAWNVFFKTETICQHSIQIASSCQRQCYGSSCKTSQRYSWDAQTLAAAEQQQDFEDWPTKISAIITLHQDGFYTLIPDGTILLTQQELLNGNEGAPVMRRWLYCGTSWLWWLRPQRGGTSECTGKRPAFALAGKVWRSQVRLFWCDE